MLEGGARALEHLCGVGMAQQVGREPLLDPGGFSQSRQQRQQVAWPEALVVLALTPAG